MQSKIIKDRKLREFIYYEGMFLEKERKKGDIQFLNKTFIPNTFYSRIRNFCVFSNRSRFIFKELHVSRLVLKKSIFSGILNNFFKKQSW